MWPSEIVCRRHRGAQTTDGPYGHRRRLAAIAGDSQPSQTAGSHLRRHAALSDTMCPSKTMGKVLRQQIEHAAVTDGPQL